MHVVAATASRMELPDVTDEIKRYSVKYNTYNTTLLCYVKGSLVLKTDAYMGKTTVTLRREGNHKTARFIATEELLTEGLRRVDPHVEITCYYAPNPMM